MKPKKLTKRAQLVQKAAALRAADGTFKDDPTRAAFDAIMVEVDALDAKAAGDLERHEVDPLDPGAPVPERSPDEDDEDDEPNDRTAGAEAERGRIEGILRAVRAAQQRMA